MKRLVSLVGSKCGGAWIGEAHTTSIIACLSICYWHHMYTVSDTIADLLVLSCLFLRLNTMFPHVYVQNQSSPRRTNPRQLNDQFWQAKTFMKTV